MNVLVTFNHTGVYSVKDPPVHIPNTEVKLHSADGTWLETARESMSMPVLKLKRETFVSFLFTDFCNLDNIISIC